MGRTTYSCDIRMRTWQVREASGPAVKVSADFAAAFDELRQADRECFFVVTLNQRHRIIDRYLVAVGTLSEALVHAREVFKPALLDSAAAVALIYTTRPHTAPIRTNSHPTQGISPKRPSRLGTAYKDTVPKKCGSLAEPPNSLTQMSTKAL